MIRQELPVNEIIYSPIIKVITEPPSRGLRIFVRGLVVLSKGGARIIFANKKEVTWIYYFPQTT